MCRTLPVSRSFSMASQVCMNNFSAVCRGVRRYRIVHQRSRCSSFHLTRPQASASGRGRGIPGPSHSASCRVLAQPDQSGGYNITMSPYWCMLRSRAMDLVDVLIIPQLGCNPYTGSIEPNRLQSILDAIAHFFFIAVDCCAIQVSVTSLECN